MPIIVANFNFNDSSDRTLTGVTIYDRASGGVLVIPSGNAYPGTPVAGELFWRTDESKLYRRNDGDTAWEEVGSGGGGATLNPADFPEMAVPGTPGANIARMFALDQNGKTFIQWKDDTGFTQQLNRDNIQRIRNTGGDTLNRGELVYITGSTATVSNVARANANAAATVSVGVIVETIANNAYGRVMTLGTLTNVDTSTYSEGDILYLSATTPGGFTATAPVHPNMRQPVGTVGNSHPSSGVINIDIGVAFGTFEGTNMNVFKIGDALAGAKDLQFVNAFILTLRGNPTAARTITLPDADGALGVLTAAAPADVTKAAAAVGASTDAARADHKHDVTTAAPGATGVATASAEGTATTLARSDHAHISNTAPVNVTVATAVIGTSGQPARADHKHNITTAAPGATGVATASAVGTSTSVARADHAHQSNTAPVNVTKAAAAIGTSGEPARADHKHDVTTAAAVAVGTANAEGASTSLARADHTHEVTDLKIVSQVQGDILYFNGTNWVRLPPGTSGQFLKTLGGAANPLWDTPAGGVVLTNTAPVDTTKAAAAVGVSGEAARSDHKHDITTAAPAAAGVATASGEGSATTLARSDHTHQSNTTPANVTRATAVIGTSGEPARADHKHDISIGLPVAVGTANAPGVATTLAASDHTHQVTGLVIAGQVQGDVLYFNGASWVRLPPGTSGHFLKTNGAAANPAWAAAGGGGAATALATTGADVVVNAAAPPSTGQVLQATSATNAAWQTIGGTGDVTAGASLANNAVILGDGGAKGVKSSAKWNQSAGGDLVATAGDVSITKLKTVRFQAEYDNGNSGAAKTIDWNNGQKQKVTMTASCTFTFTPPTDGVGHFQLKIIQNGTGNWFPTWPATTRWRANAAAAIAVAAGRISLVSFYWDGTNYFGAMLADFYP